MLILDLDMRIQIANWAAHGVRLEQLIGANMLDLASSEDRPRIHACFDQVKTTKSPGRYETTFTAPDTGAVTYWDVRVAPLLEEEQVVGFAVFCSDVSERRRSAAERADQPAFGRVLGRGCSTRSVVCCQTTVDA